MHAELADHIALLAAPIYAAMLAPYLMGAGREVAEEALQHLRATAITQALALREAALRT